jgi:hypothetical protein
VPTYCNDTDMRYWLGLPADADFTDDYDTAAERATFITQASGIADALVGDKFVPSADYGSTYQRFPDEDATSPTPPFIRHITSMLAAVRLFQSQGSVHHLKLRVPDLEQQAYDMLKMVRDGDADIYDATTGTSYGLRLATSSVDNSAEHEFTVGQYNDEGTLLSDEAGSLDRYVGGRNG